MQNTMTEDTDTHVSFRFIERIVLVVTGFLGFGLANISYAVEAGGSYAGNLVSPLTGASISPAVGFELGLVVILAGMTASWWLSERDGGVRLW